MRTKLIISANGPDRKGIVSEISSIINNYNCNIEISKMVRLENEFAMLFLIDLEDNIIEKVGEDLKEIKNLTIQLIKTDNNNAIYKHKFHLYINGADNEGIIYKFSNYLSKRDMNIEEINTHIRNAPISATPLFMMDVIIGSKKEIHQTKLILELNQISEKLGVEISLKKIK